MAGDGWRGEDFSGGAFDVRKTADVAGIDAMDSRKIVQNQHYNSFGFRCWRNKLFPYSSVDN
jgi:hypothetical protein